MFDIRNNTNNNVLNNNYVKCMDFLWKFITVVNRTNLCSMLNVFCQFR